MRYQSFDTSQDDLEDIDKTIPHPHPDASSTATELDNAILHSCDVLSEFVRIHGLLPESEVYADREPWIGLLIRNQDQIRNVGFKYGVYGWEALPDGETMRWQKKIDGVIIQLWISEQPKTRNRYSVPPENFR